jgi:hypothetical protein
MMLSNDIEVSFPENKELNPGCWTYGTIESPFIDKNSRQIWYPLITRSSIAQAGLELGYATHNETLKSNAEVVFKNYGPYTIEILSGEYKLARMRDTRSIWGVGRRIVKEELRDLVDNYLHQYIALEQRTNTIMLPFLMKAVFPDSKRLVLRELESISGSNRPLLHEYLEIKKWVPWHTKLSKDQSFLLGKTEVITLPETIYGVLARRDRHSDEPKTNNSPLWQIGSDIIDPGFNDEIITEHVIVASSKNLTLPNYTRLTLFELPKSN